MNFNAFDLNLIRVFLALWEQRSVTAAAERLNLTQPAVSHSLKRLRENFADPLFTRVGKQMEPTELARRLHAPFTQSLEIMRATMASHGTFDPGRSTRSFTVAMSDISETYVLPKVIGALMQAAPGVSIKSVQLDADEIEIKLRSGQVDMALGYLPTLDRDEFLRQFLLEDWFVCIMRAAHPQAHEPLELADLGRLDFIEVTMHATGFQMLRAMLEQMKVKRRIKAQIEHFSVIPEIVQRSNLIAIYPASVTQALVRAGGLVARPLPFEAPRIDIHAHYHRNFQSDAGLVWLAEFIQKAMGQQEQDAEFA